MPVRIAVIINPAAGRGRRRAAGQARLDEAQAAVALGRVDATIAVTERPGHTRALAREAVAAGADAVVVWGGDGTANDVAGALVGTRVALGIVPCGSGDGLVRGLRLPTRAADVVSAAARGVGAPIDVGYLGHRHFLNVAGVGFDAAVALAFEARGRPGAIGYAAAGLGLVWTYRSETYRLTLEGVPADGPLFVVAFANGRQYGSGLVLAPHADPADGRLDAVVVDAGSPVDQLWRARRMFVRRLNPARGVIRARVSSACVAGSRLLGHVDGETFEASGRLDVRVEPEALRLVGQREAGLRMA